MRILEIEVTSMRLQLEFPNIIKASPETAREAKLDFFARADAIEEEIKRVEASLGEYADVQRNFNTYGWWYQWKNRHAMDVPVMKWLRTLSKEKEILLFLKARFPEA